MQTKLYPLKQQSIGTQRTLMSVHCGAQGSGKKVYLQASLHADELPGMLVLHHLRNMLNEAESKGEVLGEIVLVPCANPIGLSQHLMRDHLGRYEFNSGENFNRDFPDFYDLIVDEIESVLTKSEEHNKRVIRERISKAIHLKSDSCTTELEDLRYQLLMLSHDADYVLDLHCDFEALPHLYADTPYIDHVADLCRFLGIETLLHARGSGASAFDEAQSGVWYRLREQFSGRYPIPLAGCGVTVELRGEADVTHALAEQDARNLFSWLQTIGVIAGESPRLPEALYEPSPLAGCENLTAPCSGVLVYLQPLGAMLNEGDIVAEVIDPMTQKVSPICTRVCGKFFARENRRFAVSGMAIGKVAGLDAFKEGVLLGA